MRCGLWHCVTLSACAGFDERALNVPHLLVRAEHRVVLGHWEVVEAGDQLGGVNAERVIAR